MKINLWLMTILYVLHEIGHIIALLMFGETFTIELFPTISGTPHLIGLVRSPNKNIIKETIIRFVSPILTQVILLSKMNKSKYWFLFVLLLSYGDVMSIIV